MRLDDFDIEYFNGLVEGLSSIQKKKNIEHWLTLHAQPGCGMKFMTLFVMRKIFSI